MSLEKILKKIIDDAKNEADRIILESKKKAEEIKKSSQEEASYLAKAFMKEARRKADLEESRLITQARLEKKISILSCKKELINGVLEKAFQMEIGGNQPLKRRLICKDGEKEESLDVDKLKEELHSRLESFIAEMLKI